MDNKTIVMNPPSMKPAKSSLGIQSDTAFTDTAKGLAGRDLISIADLSVNEMAAVLELSHAVKAAPEDFRHALDAKQMVLIFEKASLRTRLTFETAINTSGGNAMFYDQTAEPLGQRESIPDVARNLERWMNVIVLRTYAHETIIEMAANARVPVINALSDLEHPCQAIADFMTLEERFGSLEGLKFTYVGDGNNVCHSLILAGALLGVHTTTPMSAPRWAWSTRPPSALQSSSHIR
jgi:ornithine carbamoyltransferase